MAKWRDTSCAYSYDGELLEERALKESPDDWVCPESEAFMRGV